MNRELKFRVWDHEEECFNEDSPFWIYQSGEVDHDYKDRNREITIQQYTGLKDKNGKEIYEGDIMKTIYGNLAHVVFDTILGAYRLLTIDKKSIPITTYRFNENNEPVGLIDVVGEILGNIFENPELLKN